MDTTLLNLNNKNYYGVVNFLQSLENAKTYTSFMDNEELRWELYGMVERLKKGAENKIRNEFNKQLER